MNHPLGANGIDALLYVVYKNAFKIGKLEVLSRPFEPNTDHPIYTASDNLILPFPHYP